MDQYNKHTGNSRYHKPRRRRLKRSVKLCILSVSLLICVIIFRPWRWFAVVSCSSSAARSMNLSMVSDPSKSTFSAFSSASSFISSVSLSAEYLDFENALHFRLTNADSELPQAERFDRAVLQFMNRWEIKGASLAVMKDGHLVYSKGYGYADLEDSVHTEVRHIFRVASISKLITATAVMKLYEKGKLRLDSRVFGPSGILPQYTGYTDRRIANITVEQLLRHKGGFTVRSGDPMFSPTLMEVARRNGRNCALTTDQLITHSLRQGLGFTPGGRTKYSNVGYVILSKVIEQLTGMEYELYVRDSILHPVGCRDIHLACNTHDKKLPNEVRYYESSDAELVESCDGRGKMVHKCDGGNDVRGLKGAGGWVASPVEMLMFVSSIDGDAAKPDILKPSTIAKMTECSEEMLPIGWMKVQKNGDWLRTGSMAGTSAMLKRQGDGYTWFFVTNTSSWKGARFPRLISGMFNTALDRVDIWPEKDLFDQ